MSIWAIADIHASRTDPITGEPSKPMDIFGEQWANHVRRIEAAWREMVAPQDTVIVAGDTEWALHFEDALETLHRMDGWPGRKVLIRGNHDYWWSSKTTNRVRKNLPPSFVALHTSAVKTEGFNICGAKGSPVPGGMDWTDHDAKLLNRERERLVLSLAEREPSLSTIVALHFPPFYLQHPDTVYREVLENSSVACCVYGHLHGAAAASGFEGTYGKVEYRLVAADAVGFRPVLLAAHGKLHLDRSVSVDGPSRKDLTMDQELPPEDLKGLAETVMDDKRDDGNSEERARELYDVPSESSGTLASRANDGRDQNDRLD